MGGETASAWWDHMFKNCPELDICVLGEGEEAMVDILEKISTGKSIKNCSSIAYREDNKILKEGGTSFVFIFLISSNSINKLFFLESFKLIK